MDNDNFQELVLRNFDKVFTRLDTLQQDVVRLSQSQARMEHEHGEKLSVLFDGYKLLSEKLDEHTIILEKHSATLDEHTIILKKHSATLDKHSKTLDDHTARLERIEQKVAGHDIRIEVLDQTKANKRKAK